jgi:phage protein D
VIPSYSIQIGNVLLDTNKGDDLRELRVQRSLDVPADNFEVLIRPSSKVAKCKLQDPVTVSLGFGSTKTLVFKGVVDSIESAVSRIRITALSQMFKLLKLRLEQIYLGQTAGEIVKDLCRRAGVATGQVEDGVSLPSFSLSREESAYNIIKSLAERSGFDVFLDLSGKLVFKPFGAKATHTLEHGRNILRAQAFAFAPPAAVKVYGESPSSSKGSDTSHWLTKDEVEGDAGSGDSLIISDPAIRDKATANSVANSKLTQARHTQHLAVVSYGSPDIHLGDAVSLTGFDHPFLKGEYKVREVEHLLTRESGFTTKISCTREA